MAVPGTPPAGRLLLAFRPNETLEFSPEWTRIDSHPSLVTSYQIDRGRQIETELTDTGRATVQIADPTGLLDPTNPGGPYFGKIEPLIQAMIGRWNPVNDTWYTRFRGWVEELDYTVHPSQNVNMLTLSLVDIFEILAAVEMQPGVFGDPPPADPDAAGMVFYDNATVQDRINEVLLNSFGGDPTKVADWSVVFSGNVTMAECSYSPGESPMTAIQEAADAEFPFVSNVYTDRYGRLCFHGRYAKFKPDVVDGTTDNWDFISWKVGDGATVNGDPAGTAHLRAFGFERGLSHIINSAIATPSGIDLTAAQLATQLVQDTSSLATFGYRSWSAENLQTDQSLVSGVAPDPVSETRRFAEYYVTNYAQPKNRATDVAIRSMRPGASGATKTWELMSKIDIADRVRLTVHDAGGGGFNDQAFFVEGVHEDVKPLGVDYDDVTLTLDLSPDVSDTDTSMFPEVNPPEPDPVPPATPTTPPGGSPVSPPSGAPPDDGLNWILDQPFTWGGPESFTVPPKTWTIIPFASPVMVRQSNVTAHGGPYWTEITWSDAAAGGWVDPSTPRVITIPHDMPFIQGDPLSWMQISLRLESPSVAETTSKRMLRIFETTHQKPLVHAGTTRNQCVNTPPELGGVLDVWHETAGGGAKFAIGDDVSTHGNMMVVPNQSYDMYFDGLNWLPRQTYMGTAGMPMLKAGMRLVPQVWHDAPHPLVFHCTAIPSAPLWKPHFVVLQWCQRAWGTPWSAWPTF